MTPSPVDRLPKVGEPGMDDKILDRVAKAIEDAEKRWLRQKDDAQQGHDEEPAVGLWTFLAQAAIDEMNKMAAEQYDYVRELCENPPPANEKLRKLFADYRAMQDTPVETNR